MYNPTKSIARKPLLIWDFRPKEKSYRDSDIDLGSIIDYFNNLFAQNMIVDHIIDYFNNLFAKDTNVGEDDELYIPPSPPPSDNNHRSLLFNVTGLEVKQAIFSMSPLKALAPMIFNLNFIRFIGIRFPRM